LDAIDVGGAFAIWFDHDLMVWNQNSVKWQKIKM
jgi:hypothetical protein